MFEMFKVAEFEPAPRSTFQYFKRRGFKYRFIKIVIDLLI